MNSFTRIVRVMVCLLAIDLSLAVVVQAADKKKPAPPPPPRSAAELGSDLDDLEAQLNHLDKNKGTYDETQRRSIYAKLLAMAEKIGVDLARLRTLLNTATASQPKNDPTGGLTTATSETQARNLAELGKLDDRLKALKERIAALNPDLKAGVGPRPGGGAGGGAGGTTVTPPSTSTRKK